MWLHVPLSLYGLILFFSLPRITFFHSCVFIVYPTLKPRSNGTSSIMLSWILHKKNNKSFFLLKSYSTFNFSCLIIRNSFKMYTSKLSKGQGSCLIHSGVQNYHYILVKKMNYAYSKTMLILWVKGQTYLK